MDIVKDCKILQKEFSERGYTITLEEAEMIWDDYCTLIFHSSWFEVYINHHVFEDLMKLDITKEILKEEK